MSDVLQEIQCWYESQCNEDWEHTFGLTIGTLDNPGWSVKIDVAETELEGVSFKAVIDVEPEREWIHCEVQGKQFLGHGGPQQLERILQTFLDWARTHEAQKQ